MTYGFTGTQQGWSGAQKRTIRRLFSELRVTELHHGDCIGSDAQADAEAMRIWSTIVVHPPLDNKRRAFCSGEAHTVLVEKHYKARNNDIAIAGIDGLIATPKETIMQVRSGTWATIRYARALNRRVIIVYPDGTIKDSLA